MTQGIAQRLINETPVSVIDLETTGLTPGYDRIVEVSVVRIEPGEAPRLIFDSLVNPGRPVAAIEIHGIGDRDVAAALCRTCRWTPRCGPGLHDCGLQCLLRHQVFDGRAGGMRGDGMPRPISA